MENDFITVLRGAFEDELKKIAHDLTEADKSHMAKKTFAVPASKSNTGKPAYPIPDAQHARSALGFAKMHGDTSDYAKVRAAVEKKFPELVKDKEKDANMVSGGDYGAASLPTTFKAPQVGGAMGNMGPKLASGILQRLASDAGTHKAELAGLGILAAPSIDHLQAKVRAHRAGEGEHGAEKRRLFGPTGEALTELGGLGVLAGPSIAHLAGGH